MGRDEQDRRRAAVRAVLSHAAGQPSAALPFEQLPALRQAFRDRRELVLALEEHWTRLLWARIELRSRPGGRTRPLLDARELVELAWADCAARHPVLRQLLDRYRDELGPVAPGELRRPA